MKILSKKFFKVLLIQIVVFSMVGITGIKIQERLLSKSLREVVVTFEVLKEYQSELDKSTAEKVLLVARLLANHLELDPQFFRDATFLIGFLETQVVDLKNNLILSTKGLNYPLLPFDSLRDFIKDITKNEEVFLLGEDTLAVSIKRQDKNILIAFAEIHRFVEFKKKFSIHDFMEKTVKNDPHIDFLRISRDESTFIYPEGYFSEGKFFLTKRLNKTIRNEVFEFVAGKQLLNFMLALVIVFIISLGGSTIMVNHPLFSKLRNSMFLVRSLNQQKIFDLFLFDENLNLVFKTKNLDVDENILERELIGRGFPKSNKFEIKGDSRVFEVSAIKLEEGYYLVVLVDITKVVNLEREVLNLKHHEAIVMALSDIIHELKSPINAIAIDVQDVILGDKFRGNKSYYEKFLRIERNLRNLIDSVEKIKALIRPYTAKREDIKILHIITEIIEAFKPRAREKNILVVFSSDLLYDTSFKMDPWGLKIILENLLDNSLEACSEAGKIEVTVNQLEDNLIIRVKDDGKGMTKEVLERIFEPYFSTKGKGLGLGLFLVKKIVDAHNGKIFVKSEPQMGTEVEIWIPS